MLCTALKMMLDDVGESAFWGSYDRSYQTGYAASGYGATSGGQLLVQQQTHTTSMEWCEGCDLAPGDCGACVDDCGEWCGEPTTRQTGVTTQTYSFTGGQSSPGAVNAYSTGVSYNTGGSYQAAGLLVGNGDIPASAIGATHWQLQRGATFIADTDAYYQVGLSFLVDGFADQHSPWRGPYIADRINADPWGNRYMANVFALHLPPATLYNTHAYWRRHQPFFSSAVVCYSAGPNEQIETAFDQPWGWYTGGDDQTAVLAGVGGIR